MAEETLAAALGVDFEVILADRVGVIAAESGQHNPDPCHQLADLVRDVAREIVRSREIVDVSDLTGPGFRVGVGQLEKVAATRPPAEVRAEAIKFAVMVLRTATEPGSPLGAYRADRGLEELGAREAVRR